MEIVDIEECQPDPVAVTRKKSLWSKINNKTTYSYLFNIVISILLLTCLVLVLYFFKEYLKTVLYWVDAQDPWIIFLLFMCLFLIVSFPVAVGYLILIITSGYLFGMLKGMGTVLVSANFGVAVAHFTLKALRAYLPLDKLLKHDTARALLKVISGPQAFKIVFFARLTPIPFGLQNTIFAVSIFHFKEKYVVVYRQQLWDLQEVNSTYLPIMYATDFSVFDHPNFHYIKSLFSLEI